MKKCLCLLMGMSLSLGMLFANGAAEEGSTAKKYPSKPITFIVNRAAGGGTDVCARAVATAIQKDLGYTTVVNNLEGGDGLIGANEALTAKPDGYTFMIVGSTEIPNLIVNFPEAKFTRDDLVPVCQVTSKSRFLALKPGSPFSDLNSFVSYAKANPGKLTIAISGGNTIYGAVLIEEALGIDLTVVNAGSGNNAFTMVLGGHVDCAELDPQYYTNCVNENMTVLGDTDDRTEHVADAADTFKSKGIDIVDTTFNYILAPKGTPDEYVKAVSDMVGELYEKHGLADAIAQTGQKAHYSPTDQFKDVYFAYVDKMMQLYQKINADKKK